MNPAAIAHARFITPVPYCFRERFRPLRVAGEDTGTGRKKGGIAGFRILSCKYAGRRKSAARAGRKNKRARLVLGVCAVEISVARKCHSEDIFSIF